MSEDLLPPSSVPQGPRRGPAPAPVPPPDAGPPDAGPPDPNLDSLITSSVVLYGGMLVVAVIWGVVDGGRNIYFLSGQGGAPGLLGGAVGLGVGLVVVGLSRLTVIWFDWARALHREFHGLLRGLTTGQALVLAVVSGVSEEALFRGAALPTVGLWWSSILFGVVHVPLRRGLWPWPLMAGAMGLAFGWMYLRFGDLSGPILAHATINFLNLRHLAKNAG